MVACSAMGLYPCSLRAPASAHPGSQSISWYGSGQSMVALVNEKVMLRLYVERIGGEWRVEWEMGKIQ